MKRSKTLRNAQKRSGTPRNFQVGTQQRLGTNSRKWSRYGHVHAPKTKEFAVLCGQCMKWFLKQKNFSIFGNNFFGINKKV
jgi:hypothetical protein